jgi:hypothetical protein
MEGLRVRVFARLSSCVTMYTITGIRYASDNESAVAAALHAGCDFECGGTFSAYVVKSLDRGDISLPNLQQAAKRMLTPAFQMGLLDPVERQLPFLQLSARDVDTSLNRQLAFDASVQAAVLLANNPIAHMWGRAASPLLPLQTGALLRTIAVVGPLANATQTLLANYHGQNSLVEEQSVLAALQRRGVVDGFEVTFETGCRDTSCTDASAFGVAASSARNADVAIVVVGLCSDDCVGAADASVREGEGSDRTSTDLPGLQEQLVREIVATGTPTVVLFIHGGALSADWIASNVPAVLSLHYPGELGGDAAVALLFGDVSPSGRTTVTWYSSTFQTERPRITDMQLASHTSPQGVDTAGITYLYYNASVLWPFGFGLSYTEFAFAWSDHQGTGSPRRVLSVSDFLAQPPSFSVNVTNVGPRVSAVSAMAFITSGLAGEPLRECFDFARASDLAPGASVVLTFTLPPWVAATVDTDGVQALMRGEYTVSVHGGSGGRVAVLAMGLAVVGDADAVLFDMRAARDRWARSVVAPRM